MNFQFSDDQLAVQQLANSLFADFCSDDRIKALQESGTTFDTELWGKLAETGLLALTLPQELQGSGMGAIEQSFVLEEQGRHLAQVPLWRQQTAMTAIANFGDPALKARLLKPLATGEQIATVWTEAGDGANIQATRSDSGWVLNGTAECILVAGDPRYALLPAAHKSELRFFIADLRSNGIVRTEAAMTNGEPAADLEFTNVAVAPTAVLAEEMTAEWLEQRVAFSLSALQLGVTSEALRRTSVYLNEREQFGKPIGSFQAVANRMADSYIELELLRSAQWNLAWQLDNKETAIDAARVAKFQACQAGHIVGHTALHYHGGMGQDLTYPIHRFYLWAKAIEMTGGGSEAQLARISENPVPQVGEA